MYTYMGISQNNSRPVTLDKIRDDRLKKLYRSMHSLVFGVPSFNPYIRMPIFPFYPLGILIVLPVYVKP